MITAAEARELRSREINFKLIEEKIIKAIERGFDKLTFEKIDVIPYANIYKDLNEKYGFDISIDAENGVDGYGNSVVKYTLTISW